MISSDDTPCLDVSMGNRAVEDMVRSSTHVTREWGLVWYCREVSGRSLQSGSSSRPHVYWRIPELCSDWGKTDQVGIAASIVSIIDIQSVHVACKILHLIKRWSGRRQIEVDHLCMHFLGHIIRMAAWLVIIRVAGRQARGIG